MFENVIRALIALCFLVLLYWIVIWVLGILGIPLPPHFTQIIMVILVLCGILYLYRLFGGSLPNMFPPKDK